MDFLSSFNFGADSSAAPGSPCCASLEDLQLRLRDVLTEKATPTRAEHVSTTLDIGAAARFTLSLSTTESSALQGLGNLDPSLGGLGTPSVAMEDRGEQTALDVSATDALMNQPQDDPVLQRAVARHISAAVSATDGSSWIMREMSRDSQGWNFVYLCQHSSQHWSRQNTSKAKPVIGEYTQKELDPALMNRPAFDCRGTVRISFARGGRSISVRYSHTPLHKTVAEVAAYFRPPPRPTVLRIPEKAEKQRSPKKPPSARKKRDSTKALEEDGNPRKRKKQKTAEAQPHGEQQSFDPGDSQIGQGSLQLSDAVAAGGSAEGAAQMEEGPQHTPASTHFPLNLSPEETARRRDAANKLLSEAGVSPDTLSVEQFGIFANQSPDLQRESLRMLVKYGAERLRIVHPSNRDSSASAPPTAMATSMQNVQAAPSEPMELVPRAAGSTHATEGPPQGLKSSNLGKSRTACFRCKSKRIKCPKERPTCDLCQAAGVACEYAPPKPRKKKSKSDATVPADYDDEEESLLVSAPQQEPLESEPHEHPPVALPVDEPGINETQEVESEEQEPQESASPVEEPQDRQSEDDGVEEGDEVDYSSYPQVPVSDMLTRNLDLQDHTTQALHQSQLPYFRSASGLILPQAEEPPVTQNMQTSGPGFSLPQGVTHFSSHMTSTAADSPPLRRRADPPAFPQQAQHMASGSRRSLPDVPLQNQSRDNAPVPAAPVSGWSSSANQSSQAMSSPQLHKRAAGEPSSRGSDSRLSVASRMHDAAALSRAALAHQTRLHSSHTTMQPSSQANTVDPTDDLRARSRQGQRAQTKTPRGSQSFHARPPAESSTRGDPAGSSQFRPATLNMDSSPPFNNRGRYSETLPNGSTTSNKIGYEPYSYQRSIQGTAPYPAHNYDRTAAQTIEMDNSSTAPMAPAQEPNTLSLPNSLPASRSQNAPSRTDSSYNNNNGNSNNNNNNTSLAQGAGRNLHHSHTSSQDLNQRNASQAAQPGQGQGQGHGVANKYQHQQRPLPQQQQQRQQPQGHQQSAPGHQGQNWYNLNEAGNPSYPFGLQRTDYNWKMADEPW